MFEFLNDNNESENAIAILKKDHETVKDLFEAFEASDNRREKTAIAKKIIEELKIHAEIEEGIFYRSVRKEVEHDLMNEADEEHHVAKMLIAEIEHLKPTDEYFDAKMKVLGENIRHHIKEEEDKMMPQISKQDIDLEVIGRQLLLKKAQLKKNGIPVSDEAKMLKKGGFADSPAKAAREGTKPKASKSRSTKTAANRNTKAAGKKTKQSAAQRAKTKASQVRSKRSKSSR